MPDASPRPDGLGEALRALPMLDPPPRGWERMRAELRGTSAPRRAPHPLWWALAASFLLAAVLPLISTTLRDAGPDELSTPNPALVGDPTPGPTAAPDPEAQRLLALQRESALLDLLVTQRLDSGVQRADFAAVSSQVIERVQWIDTVLGDPATTSPAAQYALWSERVLLLRQLVHGDAGAERSSMPNPTYTL